MDREYTDELPPKQQRDLEKIIANSIKKETFNEATGDWDYMNDFACQKLGREILWQVMNYYKPEILTNPVFF